MIRILVGLIALLSMVSACLPKIMPPIGAVQYTVFFTEADHVLGLLREERFVEAAAIYKKVPVAEKTKQFHKACGALLDAGFKSRLEREWRRLPAAIGWTTPSQWHEIKRDVVAARSALKAYRSAAFIPAAFYAGSFIALKERLSSVDRLLADQASAAWMAYGHETLPCFFSVYPVSLDVAELLARVDLDGRLGAVSSEVLSTVYSSCSSKLGGHQSEGAWRSQIGNLALNRLGQELHGRPVADFRELARVVLAARGKSLPISTSPELNLSVESNISSIPASAVKVDIPIRVGKGFHQATIYLTHGFCSVDTVIAKSRSIPSTRLAGYQQVENPNYRNAELAYQGAMIDYRAEVDAANNTSRSDDPGVRGIQDATILYGISQKKNALDRALRTLKATPASKKEAVWNAYEFKAEDIDGIRSCSIVAAFKDADDQAYRMAIFEHQDKKSFVIARGVDPTDKKGQSFAENKAVSPQMVEVWRTATPSILLSTVIGSFLESSLTPHVTLEAFVANMDAVLREKASEENAPSLTPVSDGPVAKALRSVVAIQTDSALGSGFFVRPNLILTNAHVVGETREVRVRLADGRFIGGRVTLKDEGRDIAAVACDCTGEPMTISVRRLPAGTTVFAVGSPQDLAYFNTVTRGVISAYRPRADSLGNRFFDVQHDAAINPGNSGGPLLSADSGEVIGINTRKGVDLEGVGLAVSAEDLLGFIARTGS